MMTYEEMVKRVQHYSGFSDEDAEAALRTFIAVLASRINEGERADFASQLPAELQGDAMSVPGTVTFTRDDMYEAISNVHGISLDEAKKQVMASWEVVKEQVTPGELADIKAQLPKDIEEELH